MSVVVRNELARRVLLVAPTRRDGEVTSSLLARVGLTCVVSDDLRHLCQELGTGAAVIVLTEQALQAEGIQDLLHVVAQEPPWSDLPIVVLMQGGAPSAAAADVLRSLGNVTLLERPTPARSVISAVQAAARARERQYQMRDQLEAIRRTEAVARDMQERFEAMANSIPQLAWIARPDGHATWYNQRWYAFTGKGFEEMQGLGWESVHDPQELPRVKQTLQAALNSGEPWEDTFPLRRYDGQFRWHLSRAMPFRDEQGNITMWFGTNTDITPERERSEERQQLLESERAARQEAERVSRMKDEFLATLSHELRTPLNAIFGWVQLLKMSEADRATISQGIEVIDRNVRLQTQLIEDLLDMSRIISGKVRLDVQRVELSEVIHAALETVKPAMTAKDIRLETVIDSTVGAVSGDSGRLQQVLWNLLTNAIKFTPKGGKIHVLAERVQSHVEISVTDTGEGIDADFLPELFHRFTQADGSASRKYGGLGLGLSIVKHLVEMHGGTVRATSPGKGGGATFVIQLPLRIVKGGDAEMPHPRGPAAARTPMGAPLKLNGLKVLVVDDELDARELVKRFLVECEATTALAGSAAEAQSLLGTFKPDVILSDIGMPSQDGYAFMRAVRGQGLKTPAIALTAFARPEDRIRSIQAGYQTHLRKPVEATELIAVIASLAGRYDDGAGGMQGGPAGLVD